MQDSRGVLFSKTILIFCRWEWDVPIMVRKLTQAGKKNRPGWEGWESKGRHGVTYYPSPLLWSNNNSSLIARVGRTYLVFDPTQ